MEKRVYNLLIVALFSLFFIFNFSAKEPTFDDAFRFEQHISVDENFQKQIDEEIEYRESVIHFFETIGWLESRNRYHVGNSRYWGKYQLGRLAMRDINMNVSRVEFIESPELQEKAMISLVYRNKSYLQRYINEYEGKTMNGLYITEAGILAGAHLGGATSMKRYLDSGGRIIFKDGNGTPISYYIAYFQNNKRFSLDFTSQEQIKEIIHNEFTIKNRIKENIESNQRRWQASAS